MFRELTLSFPHTNSGQKSISDICGFYFSDRLNYEKSLGFVIPHDKKLIPFVIILCVSVHPQFFIDSSNNSLNEKKQTNFRPD